MRSVFTMFAGLLFISTANAQNVGIGTATPVNKLSVNGKVNITDSLGIGTTSPLQTLDVNGRLRVANGVIQNGSTPVNTTSDLGLYSQLPNYWMRFVTNGGRFQFFTENGNGGVGISPKMVLSEAGNVGIGIDVPAAPLHLLSPNVANTPLGSILLSRYWNGNGDTRSSSIFHYSNGTTNSDNLAFAVAGDGGSLGQPNSLSQIKMVIQANGNVGIGNTAPSAKLDVAGTIRTDNLLIANGAANGSYLRSDANGLASWATIPAGVADGTAGGNTLYWNGTSWANSNNIYNNNGNIGIGNTAPAAKLDVTGTVRTSNLVITNGAANGSYLRSDANGNASWATIPSSTVAPGTATGNTLYWNGSAWANSNNIYNNNGNIGIGTTAPATALDVRSSNETRITVGTTDGRSGALFFGNSQYGIQRGFPNELSGNDMGIFLPTAANGAIHLSTKGKTPGEFMFYDRKFGLGINTTPEYAIDVRTTESQINLGGSRSAFYFGQGFGGMQVGFPSMGTNGAVGVFTSGGNPIYLSSTGRATGEFILDEGKVGIGTDAPQYQLDVKGAAGAVIRVGSTNGSLGSVYLGSAQYGLVRGFAGENDKVGLYSSGSDLHLSTHGNIAGGGSESLFDLVVQRNSGNIGIGTNNPTNRLSVDGKANFTQTVAIGGTLTPTTGATLEVFGKTRSTGYQARSGTAGTYDVNNYFNFSWSGSHLYAFVDDVLIANGVTSDRRLKNQIHDINKGALDQVMHLRPVTFYYKDVPGTIFKADPVMQSGFIADELQTVIPSAVIGDKDALTASGNIQLQTLQVTPIIAVLTKGMQEQQAEIEMLKKELEALKKLVQTK